MSFHAGPEACVRPVTGRSPPLGHCSRPPCSPCDPACRSPYPQGGQLVSVAALCPSVSRSHLPPDVLPPEDLSAPSGQGSQLGGGPCVAPGTASSATDLPQSKDSRGTSAAPGPVCVRVPQPACLHHQGLNRSPQKPCGAIQVSVVPGAVEAALWSFGARASCSDGVLQPPPSVSRRSR